MSHADDTCPHLVRANLLEAENARLKAEVARLTKQVEMSGNNLKRCNCQECEDARKELYARIALKKGGAS